MEIIKAVISWLTVFIVLIETTQAATLSLSPGSRITQGTVVHLSCHSSTHNERYSYSVPNPFTADPTFTGSVSCCGYRSENYESCSYGPNPNGPYPVAVEHCHTSSRQLSDCSDSHSIVVVPKAPVMYTSFRKPDIDDTVTLTCEADLWSSPPAVSYTFMKDGAQIHSGRGKTYSFKASIASSGSYACAVVAGSTGSVPSPPTTVTVRLSPTTAPTTTATPTTLPPTSPRPTIRYPCESGPSAVSDYPYLYDPARYIHCDPDGKAYVENCPQGELWNQQQRKCQVPSPAVG